MSICDEQPYLKEELLLLIQAQMADGYTFIIPDENMDTPEPTVDIYAILTAICENRMLYLVKPNDLVREPTDESE